MIYEINITFRTGNSFGNGIEEDLVGCSWESIEEAKEALKCIKEHYKYFESLNRFSRNKPTEKEIDRIENSYWFCQEDSFDSGEYSLHLKRAGELKTVSAFWRGYFESLISAEIMFEENDMKFETGIY